MLDGFTIKRFEKLTNTSLVFVSFTNTVFSIVFEKLAVGVGLQALAGCLDCFQREYVFRIEIVCSGKRIYLPEKRRTSHLLESESVFQTNNVSSKAHSDRF